VRDFAIDPNDVAIAKTIVAMTHTLGMRVVAEGVETHDQLRFLRTQGCDGSLDYCCSAPVPAGNVCREAVDARLPRGGPRRISALRRRR
jgi:EAL domain-containing protein (putative c-di-GMP-specific phosphodiesterase class I)